MEQQRLDGIRVAGERAQLGELEREIHPLIWASGTLRRLHIPQPHSPIRRAGRNGALT